MTRPKSPRQEINFQSYDIVETSETQRFKSPLIDENQVQKFARLRQVIKDSRKKELKVKIRVSELTVFNADDRPFSAEGESLLHGPSLLVTPKGGIGDKPSNPSLLSLLTEQQGNSEGSTYQRQTSKEPIVSLSESELIQTNFDATVTQLDAKIE